MTMYDSAKSKMMFKSIYPGFKQNKTKTNEWKKKLYCPFVFLFPITHTTSLETI
jgi:hypothetical protein